MSVGTYSLEPQWRTSIPQIQHNRRRSFKRNSSQLQKRRFPASIIHKVFSVDFVCFVATLALSMKNEPLKFQRNKRVFLFSQQQQSFLGLLRLRTRQTTRDFTFLCDKAFLEEILPKYFVLLQLVSLAIQPKDFVRVHKWFNNTKAKEAYFFKNNIQLLTEKFNLGKNTGTKIAKSVLREVVRSPWENILGGDSVGLTSATTNLIPPTTESSVETHKERSKTGKKYSDCLTVSFFKCPKWLFWFWPTFKNGQWTWKP